MLLRLTIPVSLLLVSYGANAMAGLFGSNTLFSPVEAVVTIEGNPCENARIVQKVYKANSEEIVAETVTDQSGQFSFDEVAESRGLLSLLPGEFVATQRLVIYCDNKEYLGWANTKRSPELNSESNGQPMSLVCDLSKAHEEDDEYSGICRLRET